MATIPISFGVLLRTLRKVGYSVSAISALEQERRLPAVEFVVQGPAGAFVQKPTVLT